MPNVPSRGASVLSCNRLTLLMTFALSNSVSMKMCFKRSVWNDHKLRVAGASSQQSILMVLNFGSFQHEFKISK